MTVTANTTRNDYTAGSAQSVYNYTFQLNEAADVDVYLDGVKQTLNTHYTVQNVGNASGGTITFTLVDADSNPIHPTQGAVINIVMAMDLDRDTNYQPSGAFLASTVNNDFDRLWLATNQQQTAVNRSLRLQDDDVTTSSMELPLKDARKGKLLAFNATTGDPEATSNNQSNWDSAYNDIITSASFSGGNYTLTQRDGGTISTSLDGRYLKLSGGSVTGLTNFTEGLSINQNKAITLNGAQFVLGTNGTESFIRESAAGDLSVEAANLYLRANPTINYITATYQGAVSLYHNNSVKLATTSGGISVTGTITATGYNSSNWDTAYNDKINSISYNNNTLTLTQQNGDTLTTTIAGGGSSQWTTSGSDIYYNSGNVGIGTSSPDAILHTAKAVNSGDVPNILENAGTSGTCTSSLVFSGNGGGGVEKARIKAAVRGDGYMAFHTNDDTEKMRIDSSGRVGINTTSPAKAFHVKGDDASILVQDSATGYALQASGVILTCSKADGTPRTDVQRKVRLNGDALTFTRGPSDTEHMRIDSSGNVGIGTTSPDGKLHVYTSDSGATVNSNADDLVIESATNAGISILGDGNETQYLMFGDAANSAVGRVLYDHNTNHMGLWTNASEAMRINSSGNVGIGTSSPSNQLTVGITYDSSEDQNATVGIKCDTNHKGIMLQENDGAEQWSLGVNANGDLAFYDSGDTDSTITFQDNGNVGIGTDSPASNLHIKSATDAKIIIEGDTDNDVGEESALLQFKTDNGIVAHTMGIEQGTGNALVINAGNGSNTTVSNALVFKTKPLNTMTTTERMRIDSSGNVLVGKTSQAYATAGLELEGAGRVVATRDGESAGIFARLNSNGNIVQFRKDGTTVGAIGSYAGTRLAIGSNGVSGAVFGQNAVIPATSGTTLVNNAYDLGTSSYKWKDLHLSGKVYVPDVRSSDTQYFTHTTDVRFRNTGGSERMRIDSSGNVLVGKSSVGVTAEGIEARADGLLAVTRDGASTALFNRETSDGDIVQFRKDNTTVGSIGADSNSQLMIGSGDTGLSFQSNNDAIIPRNTSGAARTQLINLGTTGAQFKDLHLSGVVSSGDGSASAPSYTFGDDTNTGMFSPADDTIAFSEGGVERMRITSTGNVGIGTTEPSQRLHVNGVAKLNRVEIVSSGSTIAQAGFYGSKGLTIKHVYSSSSPTYATMISFTNNADGEAGRIRTSGQSTLYVTSSDQRLKENIIDAGDAGSKIDAIRIRQFDWKGSGEHVDFGVIAQELQSVAPEAVSEGETADDMMGVDYSKLVPTLIKEIQSLRNRVAELENN